MCEVASYIKIREFLYYKDLMDDGPLLYLLSGALAGVFGLGIGNVFEVLRTV